MTRLMMAAAATLLAVVLTGCGEDKKTEPAVTTTTVNVPADTTKPAETTNGEQKPAEQGH